MPLRRRAEAPIQSAPREHLFPRTPDAVLEATTLEFDLTPEEWIAAMGAHYDSVHAMRGDVRRLQTITGAVLGTVAVTGAFLGLWLTAAVWAAISLAYINAIPGQIKRQTRIQLSKTADEGVIEGLFGTHRIELREEGIADITDGYESLIRWSSVEGVEHADGLFIIYTGPNSFLPVPESAFGGSAELRAFSDTFYTLRGLEAEAASGSVAPKDEQQGAPALVGT